MTLPFPWEPDAGVPREKNPNRDNNGKEDDDEEEDRTQEGKNEERTRPTNLQTRELYKEAKTQFYPETALHVFCLRLREMIIIILLPTFSRCEEQPQKGRSCENLVSCCENDPVWIVPR